MTVAVDPELFRSAMRRFPSGVTVVTARDADRPHGFTASSFCSVSLEPALGARLLLHGSELRTPRSTGAATSPSASCATTSRTWRNASAAKESTSSRAAASSRPADSCTRLTTRCRALECSTYARHPAGDHVVIIGEVQDVTINDGDPIVYFDRRFGLGRRPRPVSTDRSAARFATLAELRAAPAGLDLGHGPWRALTQADVDRFAEATGDHQWIHLDVPRARRESLYGGPVAHGALIYGISCQRGARPTHGRGSRAGRQRRRRPAALSQPGAGRRRGAGGCHASHGRDRSAQASAPLCGPPCSYATPPRRPAWADHILVIRRG